jgi:2-aminoadipate transaminase
MNHELSRRATHSQPSMIREILKVTQNPNVISLAGGLPAAELFPLKELREAQDRVVVERGAAAFQYSVTEGVPELRTWIAQRMTTRYGCAVEPNDVVVTSGSQQGLDMFARVLIDPGDTIVVEDPTYLGALQAFDAYEPSYLTVATDADGIIPEALDAALRGAKKRPKFLYLIPNFENPTGITLARERRPKIVEICEAHDLPILEDDPYGEICFDAAGPPPPLLSYAKKSGITYLGTGSKIAAPGLRVAWTVTRNKALHDKLVTAKQGADLCSSPWAQYVLYEFVRSEPRLQAHLDIVRAAYRSRRDAMIGALSATMPKEASWNTPAGGMFLWAKIPGVNTDELFEVAARDNVVFVPGRTFFAHRDRADGMRLNFSARNEATIREGIERLSKAVREFEGAPA